MMDFAERLAKERRARLAAERLLEHKSRELFAANEKLALHARSLSNQIVEQREAVRSAIDEAENLKGQQHRFVDDLDRAHTQAVMAERRLWDSINTFTDGFAVFDAEQRLVAANRAFGASAKHVGIEPGCHYSAYFDLARAEGWQLADGSALPQDWCDRLEHRLDQKPHRPTDMHTPDGHWIRLIERRARGGDFVCFFLDITEEKRIWTGIEAIPDAFVLFDRDERLLACNQNYRVMFPDSAPVMAPGVRFEELLRYGLANNHVPDAIGREEEWLAERLDQMRHAEGTSFCQLADGRWIEEIDHRTPDGGRVGLRRDITAERQKRWRWNRPAPPPRRPIGRNRPFWPICPTKYARR
jgi:PAS domain-containing protein